MCGITGIYAFNELGKFHMINLAAATDALASRGPDFGRSDIIERVGLGHRRLSIIDPSADGHQPMRDPSGRYTIVFNGEIYNYQSLRQRLQQQGVTFQSATDTEVLLQLYIHEGAACLEQLNGFFAFAIYDERKDLLFIARDRIGIKPLVYYHDEDKVLFASEIKSLLAYGIEKRIDYTSLQQYLQFNYVPAPHTMLQGIKKLMPGQYLKVSKPREERVQFHTYYQIPFNEKPTHPTQDHPARLSYGQQQKRLATLLEDSVQRRLVADVPLGAFLSGGIDSSVIATLASRHVKQLNTFSVGYRDEPFFDETRYARQVADKLGTHHTVFSLTNRDLYEHLHELLDYLDEPFADSSALPVYILSKKTRQRVTVALSGDGADELFSGYTKHQAAWRTMHLGWAEQGVRALLPLWQSLPKSRNGKLTNKLRQLQRFAEGAQLTAQERYLRWATFMTGEETKNLLSEEVKERLVSTDYEARIQYLLRHVSNDSESISQWLYTDTQLVLPNDMLTKVDWMSMAHGLEVRVPFLDHRVVEYAFQLPEETKINRQMKKRIVQDTFRSVLPKSLYRRPKKGFEVPLLGWFRSELKSTITQNLLEDAFIADQGIFDPSGIQRLRQQLFSSNPGDAHATVWALIVFQWWWKKYLG